MPTADIFYTKYIIELIYDEEIKHSIVCNLEFR